MSDGKKLFDFFELARQQNGRFIHKIDNLDYYTRIEGIAARGTLDSSASWILAKFVTAGNITTVHYADNANFTQIWDDRVTVFSGMGVGDGSATIPDYTTPTVQVIGSVTVSGLSTAMVTTVVTVGTSAVALPTSALSSRNSTVIRNPHATESLFIGDANTVTTSGANRGWEIYPESEFSVDITDGITVYGIVGSGTIDAEILEIS